jgi:hypothetical protein
MHAFVRLDAVIAIMESTMVDDDDDDDDDWRMLWTDGVAIVGRQPNKHHTIPGPDDVRCSAHGWMELDSTSRSPAHTSTGIDNATNRLAMGQERA